MKSYTLIFKALILFFAISCSSKSTQNGATNSTEQNEKSKMTYQELASSKFGDSKISYQLNESESYVICSTKVTENNLSYIKLFIYNIITGEIAYEPSNRFRKAKWISDDEMEAYILVGMPNSDNPDGKLTYNVKTKNETTPNNN